MKLRSHPFPNHYYYTLSPPLTSLSQYSHFSTTRLTKSVFPILEREFKPNTNYIRKSAHLAVGSIRCEMQFESEEKKYGYDDGFYMRKCVELARKAIGCTSPNPMVGCVIVKDGKIIGEGFHPKAGQPHAEVYALRDAGGSVENATVYVSLEPCNHYGRTPPCSEALIKAKVKRIVVGMVDPNPIVASKGVDKLRDAGIDVTVGVEEQLCKKLNEAYIHQMLTGKPFLTLRYTLSLNGNFLDQLGEGATECGGYYSKLLQEYDAIITSPTLLIKKSSFPTSQEPEANQPLQILIAKNPISQLQVPVLTTEECSRLIIFTDKETTEDSETARMGIETVVLDHIDLNLILEYCKQQGLCSVLVDLRGDLCVYEDILKEGLAKDLLRKVVIEVLPVLGGSKQEIVPIEISNPEQRLKLKNLTSRMSGESILLEGYF